MEPIQIDPITSRFLDSIRGISAIIILFSHVIQIFVLPYFGTTTPLDDIVEFLASYAVMTFFIISGFVIATSILKNIQNNGGRFVEKKFLYDRLTRLYPPLIFALLLTIAVYFVIKSFNLHGIDSYLLPGDLYSIRSSVSLTWDSILACVLFIQNIVPNFYAPEMNGALWSLGYEFWFYILAMVFTTWVVNKRFFTGGILLAVMVAFLVAFDNPLFLTFFITWSGGAVWALLYHRNKNSYGLVKLYILPVLLLITAILILKSGVGLLALNAYYNNLLFEFLQTSVCLIEVIFFMFITSRIENKEISFWGLHKTAKFSYTLYVVHFPLLMLGYSLFHPILHPLPWGVSIVVGLCLGMVVIIISNLLARWLENKNSIRRLLKWGCNNLLIDK